MTAVTRSVCKEAELFRHTQFIYELELAQWELQTLCGGYETNGDLRHFSFDDVESGRSKELLLRQRTAYFAKVNGERSDYAILTARNRTRSPNQFLTHWIYPYKGKFHPQMIRALLNIIGVKPEHTVLDPFMGSGTAALETQLIGADFIGFDISPVCTLLGRVKTQSHTALPAIEAVKEEVVTAVEPSLFHASKTGTLNEVISRIPDVAARDFFQVAELLSHSDKARRGRDFVASFARNVEAMIASAKDYAEVSAELGLQTKTAQISQDDARALPLKNHSVDAVITSPPYSIALDYIANDAHALSVLGCNLDEARSSFIGLRGAPKERIQLFNEDMLQVLSEIERVLKPGGHCVLILGNAVYQTCEVPTVKFADAACRKLGLTPIRQIEKTIFGLYNIMQSESIMVFRKG